MFALRHRIRRTLPMIVVAGLALLPGCFFSVPVGDPESSKADPALVGYWVDCDKGDDKSINVYTVTLSEGGAHGSPSLTRIMQLLARSE